MAKNFRSVCLRTFGGILMGSFMGPMAGFVIATIDAPPVDPVYELSDEWYTPFVLIVILPLSLILGAFVGAFGANVSKNAGGKAFLGACAGLGTGLIVGWGIGQWIPIQRRDGGQLIFHLILTACWTACGVVVAMKASAK